MQLFRYKEDRIPTLLFFGYFALDVLVYLRATELWMVVSWMLIGILPKAFISAWNHHHQHVPTFRHTLPNRLLEIVYAFHTGICTNGWVLHHVLGHHQHYLNQDLDESRWKDGSGRKMGVIRYAVMTALTGYPRAFIVGLRFPKHQRPFVSMAIFVLALLALAFWHNWVNALFVFALPMLISFYITAWHTYYHHAGLETDNDFEASYNILDPAYNYFTGNLGYHTAHHYRMGAHWSKLPEIHESIADKIPPHLIRKPPPPFKWFCASQ